MTAYGYAKARDPGMASVKENAGRDSPFCLCVVRIPVGDTQGAATIQQDLRRTASVEIYTVSHTQGRTEFCHL
jgi:hypothetical protein